MNDPWSCPFASKCILKGMDFCGHMKGGPLIVSYHAFRDREGIPECYVGHVIASWEEWGKNRVRRRYLPSIHRLLRTSTGTDITLEDVETLMNILILDHDVGKLTISYQDGRFYRHEITSSCFLYHHTQNWINEHCKSFDSQSMELISSIVAATAYLHHEGLQIKRHWKLRDPTYSYLINLIYRNEFHMCEAWKLITNKMEKHYLSLEIPITLNELERPEIAQTLGSIITTVDGEPEPLVVRMTIASLLQPLTICDNLAAQKRGGRTTKFGEEIQELFTLGVVRDGAEDE